MGGMEATALKGADLLRPHMPCDSSDHGVILPYCDLPVCAAVKVLGVKEYHRSCTENLHEGLSELGLVPPEVGAMLTQSAGIPARHSVLPVACVLTSWYTCCPKLCGVL